MACLHSKRVVVWTDVTTNGAPMQVRALRHQCWDCGMLFSNSLPHAMARTDTPSVNVLKLKGFLKSREAERQLRGQDWRREFFEKHGEYLNTNVWRAKRKLVMERAGGLCEGCRERRAKQVHHLTYEHWGHEFLWELVAICEECHERFHENRKPDFE